MPNISIKYATLSELSRVMLVTKLAYKIPYKENTLVTKPHEPENIKEKFLNKDFFVLTAVCDDKIVGAVRYEIRENNHLYFFKLAVLKPYRKQCMAYRTTKTENPEVTHRLVEKVLYKLTRKDND